MPPENQVSVDTSVSDDVDPEREIAQARMDVLLPCARARMTGNRPLSRDQLRSHEKRLDVGLPWMYRRIAYTVENGCNVTWKDFKKRESSGGKGEPRGGETLMAELERAISHAYYDLKLRPGKKGITRAISAHMVRRGKVRKMPGAKKIAKWTKHYCERYAQVDKGSTGARPALGAVMDTVAMDWTARNCRSKRALVVLRDNEQEIGVANLLCGVEEVTLLPWGWLWCVGDPSQELIPECVFRGTLTKRTLSAKYNLTHRASVAGKPRLVSFPSNRRPSNAVARQLAQSRIDIQTEVREIPNKRLDELAESLYDRFLGFLNDGSEIATDIKKLSYRCRKDTSEHLYIHWADLEKQWATWCFHYYNVQKLDRLEDETPAKRFEDSVKPATLPPEYGTALVDIPQNKYLYLREEKRVFNQHGIEIRNRFYGNTPEVLKPTFREDGRSSRIKRSVWVSAIDLTEVYVRNPEKEDLIIPIQARRPKPGDLLGWTEWEWAVDWKAKQGPNNPSVGLSDLDEPPAPAPGADTREAQPQTPTPPAVSASNGTSPLAPAILSLPTATTPPPALPPTIIHPPSTPIARLQMSKRKFHL